MVLHNGLLVCILMYGNETVVWGEKERFSIWGVQEENLRSSFGIRRTRRILSSWVGELCGGKNGVDERVSENVIRWFDHIERMDNSRTDKRGNM